MQNANSLYFDLTLLNFLGTFYLSLIGSITITSVADF